ncbi:MAG TPA: AarF/UbiB family protein [Nitrospirales bacterium]|nr:AarF/UbiB family protein [Nitrospirales bacterium]
MGLQSKMADLGRLHEIIRAFSVAGFGDIFKKMGLEAAAEQTGKIMGWQYAEDIAHLERPQRIRKLFEVLGPTFVKLGQILATRPDLFGPEWISEFEKLQSQAPQLDFEELRPQIEEDLGAPLEDLFAEVDTKPLAAASMAQVHRATLKDGTKVVLKIQRPGIREKIEADMRLLTHVASLAENNVSELATYHPQKVVQQFVKSLQNELNFMTEGQNAEQVSANFEDNDRVVIPKIYWEWTKERISVQEFVEGIPGVNIQAIDQARMDRKRLARTGANAVLKMIMVDGLFHADPHPGNFFILPGERIAFIDFGMVGRVSEIRRQQIMRLLQALLQNDAEGLCSILLQWSEREGEDPGDLLVPVDEFLGKYSGRSMEHLDLSVMVGDLLALIRNNKLTMPPDQAMLLKVFVSLEGAFKKLDPGFDMMAAIQPTLQEAVLNQLSPKALGKRGLKVLIQYLELFADIPKEIRRGIYTVKTGNLKFCIELTQLDELKHVLIRAVSRLAVAAITSALVIGTSIVMALSKGPIIGGINIYQIFGVGAIIGGVFILLAMMRDKTWKKNLKE